NGTRNVRNTGSSWPERRRSHSTGARSRFVPAKPSTFPLALPTALRIPAKTTSFVSKTTLEEHNPTIAAPIADEEGLWSAIKESIRGSHRNYTTGPIRRAILLLAIPMVLEMLMESVFAVVDMYWASRIGTDAMAAIGITESFLT